LDYQDPDHHEDLRKDLQLQTANDQTEELAVLGVRWEIGTQNNSLPKQRYSTPCFKG
jgi:hypothetical protein